jgi:YtkA-like
VPATLLRIPGTAFFVHLGGVPVRSTLAALVCAAVAGCAGDPSGGGPIEFSGPPHQTLATASGQLRVDVRWWPQPPHVGDGAAELAVTDAAGAPAAGMALSVLLWMPAHGHGASVQPRVEETAPGVYVAAPLYLFMSGEWQLLMTLAGTIDDTATASLNVP